VPDKAMKLRIGFVGLGKMGKPMAANLLRAGHPLVVYDVRDEAVQELCGLGAERASSPRDAASRAAAVITMLPSSGEVESVVLGRDGMKEVLSSGSIYIDMSTVHPETSRRIAHELSGNGVAVLEAPVSRGQAAAIDGTLSIMVGGNRATYERCMEIFRALGTDVFYCGESGMGAVFKLVNNLLVAINTCSISEALVMGVKAGADLESLLKVLTASSANSFVLEKFFPERALKGNFEASGSTDTVCKDLELALDFGGRHRVPMPFGAASYQLYSLLRGQGFGHRDFTSVLTLAEDAAGVKARLP
jgi:3-hydroxyisobutyrate dehydrogenase